MRDPVRPCVLLLVACTARIEEGGAKTLRQLVRAAPPLPAPFPHTDERLSFEYRMSGLLAYAERE